MLPTSAKRKSGLTSQLIRLARRFLFFFLLLGFAGALAAPFYNRIVGAASGLVFRVVERPVVTEVRAEKGALWIYRETERGPEPFNYFDFYVYFAAIPLLALVLATPRLPNVRRARRAASGIALLFVLHLVYIVGSVELAYVAVGLSPVGPATHGILDWAQVLLRLFWEVGPIGIFVGLSVRDWRTWVGRTTSGKTGTAGSEGDGPLAEGLAAG